MTCHPAGACIVSILVCGGREWPASAVQPWPWGTSVAMAEIQVRAYSPTAGTSSLLGAVIADGSFKDLAEVRSIIDEQLSQFLGDEWLFHTGEMPITKVQEKLPSLGLEWLLNKIVPGSGTAGGGHILICRAAECHTLTNNGSSNKRPHKSTPPLSTAKSSVDSAAKKAKPVAKPPSIKRGPKGGGLKEPKKIVLDSTHSFELKWTNRAGEEVTVKAIKMHMAGMDCNEIATKLAEDGDLSKRDSHTAQCTMRTDRSSHAVICLLLLAGSKDLTQTARMLYKNGFEPLTNDPKHKKRIDAKMATDLPKGIVRQELPGAVASSSGELSVAELDGDEGDENEDEDEEEDEEEEEDVEGDY